MPSAGLTFNTVSSMIAILISFEMNATAEMLADIRSIGHLEPVIANFCCGVFVSPVSRSWPGSAFSPFFTRGFAADLSSLSFSSWAKALGEGGVV